MRHASTEQIRWAAARDLVLGLVLIAGTWLLRGLLISVRDGDAFIEANVRRLRALAVLILVGVPIASFLHSAIDSALASSVHLVGGGARIELPGNAVLGGLAALVLAEVFASGLRLRADLEGTV